MDKNKLVLPVSILLGCIILGGFYYASEANKETSIERQQQIDLQAKQEQQQEQQQAVTDQNNAIANEKAGCVTQAQQTAINEYETSATCTGSYAPKDCKDGTTYLVTQYNNAYDTCLESDGLK